MPIKFDRELAVRKSVSYLASDEAIASIVANPYWPKWNSPWWHMSLLFEMGLANLIPNVTAQKMLFEIKRTHLPYFFREDAPKDKASYQDSPCPCSLGNIYQILSSVGLDVDDELPWARSWFLKYQMSDGGLSCDEDAYQADSHASSMVGTIAPLEAILSKSNRLSKAESEFLNQGANCLIERELRLGSKSVFNAEERADEGDWLKLCFPRFYFYDVLRGLAFLLKWSDKLNQPLQTLSISQVVEHLESLSRDGKIRIARQCFDGVTTKLEAEAWSWEKRQPASHFGLLDEVSEIGIVSTDLTAQWDEAKRLMSSLSRRGLLL